MGRTSKAHAARTRPTYAVDLPGFGLSERSERHYTVRLYTDAIHVVLEEVRRRHGPAPVHALALSLASEFLARAATEVPSAFRTLSLVSPTGFDRRSPRMGPPGSTRNVPGLYLAIGNRLVGEPLFRGLTRPGVVRYFLERTFGSKTIDEELWAYDVLTVQAPGARFAPLYFVSGSLFSNDVGRVYDGLAQPVWMSHGVRGDFTDYEGAERMRSKPTWSFSVFQTGGLPHFEQPAAFLEAHDAFLARHE